MALMGSNRTRSGLLGIGLMRNSLGQTISNVTTTVLTFDTVDFDDLGFCNTSNERIEITRPCFIQVTTQIAWNNNGTGMRYMLISEGGTTDTTNNDSCISTTFANATNDSRHCLTSRVYKVNAGDFFETRVRQDSGGNLDVTADFWTCYAAWAR